MHLIHDIDDESSQCCDIEILVP